MVEEEEEVIKDVSNVERKAIWQETVLMKKRKEALH